MNQWKILFFRYRKVLKNVVLLCTVFVAIYSKTERVRFLSLGVASGILVIELAESFDRIKKTEPEKVSEE
jgi:hypothetical protein